MAGEGWTWRVEPPEGWLLVPTTATLPPDLLAAWELEVAGLVRSSLFDDQESGVDEDPDAVLDAVRDGVAAESVANLRAFADGVIDGGALVVATFRVPDSAPVPVLATVGIEPPGDPGDDLMTALGATGGNPVAPPKIEYVDLPDGDGMRVTRLDLDPETGGAWVSVCLGRRTEHADAVVDTVLQWRSQDLLHGPSMTELLDELLPAVHIIRSTP
ncbi:hypothetical protein [Promicromonospora iranensis]|uniref:ESAT-6 protein secretion system EspG family protein n=1 Tax=Promicromonospora iranensis TaxID=1105144 RepID=A0ABU2CUF1_9MICO|nr:hypothetical protein [Promicromonospora iranensis]MDR7384944.1 hypothetical protein [Promicromonospora iranensis]